MSPLLTYEESVKDRAAAAVRLPSILRASAAGSLRAGMGSCTGCASSDEAGHSRQLEAVQRNYASLSRVVSIKQGQLDEVSNKLACTMP